QLNGHGVFVLRLGTADEYAIGRARLQSCGPLRRSARNSARGERLFANPWNPCLRDQRAPAGARGAPATPAGVHIVIPLLSGGSLRSPPANLPSPRWGGIRTTEVVASGIFKGAAFGRNQRPHRRDAETLSFFVFLSEPAAFSSKPKTSLLIPFFSRGA